MRIIRRSEWGARRAPGPRTRPLPARRAYLHHSVTLHLGTAATQAEEMAQVRYIEEIGHQRFGRFGYGIGYTFLVFPSGRVYEGHPIEYLGAHTAGHNTEGIGICWPGNYTTAAGTSAQVRATAQLLVHAEGQGWLTGHQLAGGHRDVYPTACPGDRAYRQLGQVNAQAELLAHPVTPAPAPTTPNGIWTVRAGDTLGAIAQAQDTSVAALVMLNGLPDPDRIKVGQRLFTRWVVGRGQTLGAIAEAAGTTVATLAKLNGLPDPDRIDVGQLLRLP